MNRRQSRIRETYEVSLVDSDEDFTSLRALSNLVDSIPLALPVDRDSNVTERLLDELSDGVSLPRCEDEIIGFVLLEHTPHALDVVASVSPITLGVEVTEVLRSGITVSLVGPIAREDYGKRPTRHSC